MAIIVFYEKPGCANNARQKKVLATAGHEVRACDLLTEPWTPRRLQAFFEELPVREWFNRAAPRVKSGEVVPEDIDASTALSLMVDDPFLIRRPLMEYASRRIAGFDVRRVEHWLGEVLILEERGDIQTCRHDTEAMPSGPGDYPRCTGKGRRRHE